MSEVNGPDLCITGLFATTSFAFLIYHTWRLDGCRCLIPRRDQWFKSLMTFMLFSSNACLLVWAWGWAYVKYSLGWVRLGPHHARPWPSALFPPEFQHYNTPLTIMSSLFYSLQASLNAEEALYWAYTMKVARQRRAAVPFLQSHYFHAWIATSMAIFAIQLAAPWVGYKGDSQRQLATELVVGGILELLYVLTQVQANGSVLVASTAVVFRFPKFMKDVEQLGAGPEIRTRLYYYDQLNQNRTFCRFAFCITLLITGIDGLTTAATINITPMSSDILATVLGFSLSAVFMISVVLYLPRPAPSSVQNKVMVGQHPPLDTYQHSNGLAILSVLREGGQWEGGDGDLLVEVEELRDVDTAPFANAEASGSAWYNAKRRSWQGADLAREAVNFESPIAVDTPPVQSLRAVQIHIQVERSVHKD